MSNIDLNLLVIFDAISKTRHLGRAADLLKTSQPTMSRALASLREIFGDPLFVRSQHGLIPTARAEQLVLQIRPLLEAVNALLIEEKFEPARTDRVFNIATSDYGASVVVPAISNSFAAEAPNARLRTLPLREITFSELQSGAVDIIITSEPPADGKYRSEVVLSDRWVGVMRASHPYAEAVRRGDILEREDMRPFLAAVRQRGCARPDHPIVMPNRTEHPMGACSVHPAAVGPIVARSDAVVALPARLAAILAPPFDLLVFDVPSPEDISLHAVWHERLHRDPATLWLRNLLRSVISMPEVQFSFAAISDNAEHHTERAH